MKIFNENTTIYFYIIIKILYYLKQKIERKQRSASKILQPHHNKA